MRHRRIAEVVEVHVFDTVCYGIREPTVDKTGSSLDRLRVRSGKCHEVRAGIPPVVENRETGDDLSVVARDVALYVVRRDGGHRAVILDVILLIQVLYRGISESLHEFEIRYFEDFRTGSEELFRRATRTFVPLFPIVRRIDDRKACLGKMGTDPHVSPALGNIFPSCGNPDDETGSEATGLKFRNVRLFFEPFEFRDVEKASDVFQPSETLRSRNGPESANFEVFAVRDRIASVIRMILRKVLPGYFDHV